MKDEIKITILGDVMLKHPMISENYDYIFENVKSYLNKSDYVIGNLETTLSHKKTNLEKYKFVSPIEFAMAIKNAGINFVSTANNHCLDNGIQGIDETIECLDEVKIEHTGTFKEQKKLFNKKIKGVNIGIIAYTYGTNAFDNKIYLSKEEQKKICLLQNQELSNKFINKIYNSKKIQYKILRKISKIFNLFQINMPVYERKEKSFIKEIKKDIELLDKNTDFMIMLLHDGGQNNNSPIKRIDNNINELLKTNINAIIGNHEHMIHKAKMYNKKIITYSIGNFTGNSGVNEEPFDKMQEYSVGINIYINNKMEKRYTYTIFKNVLHEDGKIRVNLLYDLINSEKNSKDKEKLIIDLKKIIRKLEIPVDNPNDICVEYSIKE